MILYEVQEGAGSKRAAQDDREDGDEEQGSSKRPATDETALSSVAEDEAIRPADVEAARQLVEKEAQAGLEALAQYGSSSESDEDVRIRDHFYA